MGGARPVPPGRPGEYGVSVTPQRCSAGRRGALPARGGRPGAQACRALGKISAQTSSSCAGWRTPASRIGHVWPLCALRVCLSRGGGAAAAAMGVGTDPVAGRSLECPDGRQVVGAAAAGLSLPARVGGARVCILRPWACVCGVSTCSSRASSFQPSPAAAVRVVPAPCGSRARLLTRRFVFGVRTCRRSSASA